MQGLTSRPSTNWGCLIPLGSRKSSHIGGQRACSSRKLTASSLSSHQRIIAILPPPCTGLTGSGAPGTRKQHPSDLNFQILDSCSVVVGFHAVSALLRIRFEGLERRRHEGIRRMENVLIGCRDTVLSSVPFTGGTFQVSAVSMFRGDVTRVTHL